MPFILGDFKTNQVFHCVCISNSESGLLHKHEKISQTEREQYHMVSQVCPWVKFKPFIKFKSIQVFPYFCFFPRPVFWFDFYINLRWCTRDTRAPSFFRGCLPGLMLHWFTTVFKEVNIPRYLQVFLKDFDLSLSHTPEAKLLNLRTNYLNWLRV